MDLPVFVRGRQYSAHSDVSLTAVSCAIPTCSVCFDVSTSAISCAIALCSALFDVPLTIVRYAIVTIRVKFSTAPEIFWLALLHKNMGPDAQRKQSAPPPPPPLSSCTGKKGECHDRPI